MLFEGLTMLFPFSTVQQKMSIQQFININPNIVNATSNSTPALSKACAIELSLKN